MTEMRINPLRPPTSPTGGVYGTPGFADFYKRAKAAGEHPEELKSRRMIEIRKIREEMARHKVDMAREAQNRAIGKTDAPSEMGRIRGVVLRGGRVPRGTQGLH